MRYLILLLLITSCASRKVDISKTTTESKVDSSVVVKTDGTYVKNNNIFIEQTIDEVEYKPLDSLKPMIIDGKSYTNTVIKSKKNRSIKTDTTKEIAKTSSIKKLNVKKEDFKQVKKKAIDKKVNYLWLILIPIGMYIYRQIKSKLWL
jgi:hypothetical protein